jgi:hypothetical protein
MCALKGMLIATLSSLVVAILFAFAFRVPIPLADYLGPFGEFGSHSTGPLETISTVLWLGYFMAYLGVLHYSQYSEHLLAPSLGGWEAVL